MLTPTPGGICYLPVFTAHLQPRPIEVTGETSTNAGKTNSNPYNSTFHAHAQRPTRTEMFSQSCQKVQRVLT